VKVPVILDAIKRNIKIIFNNPFAFLPSNFILYIARRSQEGVVNNLLTSVNNFLFSWLNSEYTDSYNNILRLIQVLLCLLIGKRVILNSASLEIICYSVIIWPILAF